MSAETLSATATAFAIVAGLLIVAFNLGKLTMSAKARQCAPTAQTFVVPFKGTLP
jgi:hypothetical protein